MVDKNCNTIIVVSKRKYFPRIVESLSCIIEDVSNEQSFKNTAFQILCIDSKNRDNELEKQQELQSICPNIPVSVFNVSFSSVITKEQAKKRIDVIMDIIKQKINFEYRNIALIDLLLREEGSIVGDYDEPIYFEDYKCFPSLILAEQFNLHDIYWLPCMDFKPEQTIDFRKKLFNLVSRLSKKNYDKSIQGYLFSDSMPNILTTIGLELKKLENIEKVKLKYMKKN